MESSIIQDPCYSNFDASACFVMLWNTPEQFPDLLMSGSGCKSATFRWKHTQEPWAVYCIYSVAPVTTYNPVHINTINPNFNASHHTIYCALKLPTSRNKGNHSSFSQFHQFWIRVAQHHHEQSCAQSRLENVPSALRSP